MLHFRQATEYVCGRPGRHRLKITEPCYVLGGMHLVCKVGHPAAHS